MPQQLWCHAWQKTLEASWVFLTTLIKWIHLSTAEARFCVSNFLISFLINYGGCVICRSDIHGFQHLLMQDQTSPQPNESTALAGSFLKPTMDVHGWCGLQNVSGPDWNSALAGWEEQKTMDLVPMVFLICGGSWTGVLADNEGQLNFYFFKKKFYIPFSQTRPEIYLLFLPLSDQ